MRTALTVIAITAAFTTGILFGQHGNSELTCARACSASTSPNNMLGYTYTDGTCNCDVAAERGMQCL
jgi:hypothetical protein